MSTNFYAGERCGAPCAHCKPVEAHIGKRSGGWTFGFESRPGLTTRKAWQEYLRRPGVYIFDEYGQEYTADEFDALVDATREPWGPNKVEPARRGDVIRLLGAPDDRYSCDPEGWDFWDGDFS